MNRRNDEAKLQPSAGVFDAVGETAKPLKAAVAVNSTERACGNYIGGISCKDIDARVAPFVPRSPGYDHNLVLFKLARSVKGLTTRSTSEAEVLNYAFDVWYSRSAGLLDSKKGKDL